MAEDAVFDPKVIEGAFSVAGILKWVLIVVVAGLLVFGIIRFLKTRKRYIYKPEFWGISGGIPDVLMGDKARPIKVRTKEGINSLMFFKKLKRYLKMPNRLFFLGKRIRFWFRQDGELTPIMPVKVKVMDLKKDKITGEEIIEGESAEKIMDQVEKEKDFFVPLVMEDVNEKFAVMNVKFINEDARLSHVSTGKIVREMFSLNKFFKEHGATIMLILGIIVLAFAFVLMVDGMKEYSQQNEEIAAASGKLAERIDKINEGTIVVLEKLDSLIKKPTTTQTTIIQNAPQETNSTT